MAKASSWIPHVEAFVDCSRHPNQQAASLHAIASLTKNDLLSIEALVKEMELYLTTTDNVIRARGILLLAELLTNLKSKPLDNATVHSLIGFFTERLADWQAVRGALIGCLALLRRKNNAGMVTGTDARAVAQSYLLNLQVQSLGQQDRKLCFELLDCLLTQYPGAVTSLGDNLVYGVCEAIDGEKDPQCLMLTFHLVEVLAQLFPDPSGPLSSFAGDLFEIIGCYFPIHFTHPKANDTEVKRDDLSRALMLAFSSTSLFEPFVISLLLDKLSSALPLAKVESLQYLSSCALKYGSDRMARHAKAIWSSLKDAIFTSTQEPVLDLASETLDFWRCEENEVAKEALMCLQNVTLQNEGLFLNLIVDDEDIGMMLKSVTSFRHYDSVPVESKWKLHAIGCILSITAKASIGCCNRVFQNFFPLLMNIFGFSVESGDSVSKDSCMISEGLNFGALYLCIALLSACRSLAADSQEVLSQSIFEHGALCCLLHKFSGPLVGALSTALTNINEDACDADMYSEVKGLQIFATFPGYFLPISESIFENILTTFMSMIAAGCENKLLWKEALKAIVQIGIFVENACDSEKALRYRSIVIETIVSWTSSDDSSMLSAWKLEAVSEIGMSGLNFMQQIIQGFEDTISANFLEAFVKGNLKSARTIVQLLDCYSNRLLPWFHNNGGSEEILLHFAVNLWNQIGNSMCFSTTVHGKEFLDTTMTAMRLSVQKFSVENQGLVLKKAYSVVSASLSFELKALSASSIPVNLEDTEHSFSHKDEWLISLFASVIVALRPQTDIPNMQMILKVLVIALLSGNFPAAQALGSMLNKLPSEIDRIVLSSASCALEDAIDIIFNTSLWSACGKASLKKCSADNVKGGLVDICVNFDNKRSIQIHAIAGLAWLGKGLLMRGHQKVKDITMIFLRCLLSSSVMELSPQQQGILEDVSKRDLHSSVMRSAADAFHILLSDSEVCLNKRFFANIRPLYKQHFFSIMLPILLKSILECDSSMTRSMLYRAFGHVISCTPLTAIVTEAKKIIPVILDSLSTLNVDVLDKDLIYSLLLVLSGILMDENGQEGIIENAHFIIKRLIGLISYPHMMLVRETAIQCLVAMAGLPHTRIYPMRIEVIRAMSKALDDPKRAVRQEAVRCRQAWASIASRSLHF